MLQKGIVVLIFSKQATTFFTQRKKIGWRFLPLDEAMDKSTGLMISDLMSL